MGEAHDGAGEKGGMALGARPEPADMEALDEGFKRACGKSK
jgi:hypothetical protein